MGAAEITTLITSILTGIAKVAKERLAEGTDDKKFYETKLITGKFFMERLLPDTGALLSKLTAGAATMMALDADAF